MMAVLEDKKEAVNSLLDHGANPLLEDNRKRSSIHHVAKGGNITMINMMLSKGLAVNSRKIGVRCHLSLLLVIQTKCHLHYSCLTEINQMENCN